MIYILFAPLHDATNRLFDDVKALNNVQYKKFLFHNKIIDRMYFGFFARFHIRIKVIEKFFCVKPNVTNDDICVIYIDSRIIKAGENFLVKKIKRKYPHSKHIIYYLDIHVARKTFSELQKEIFDGIFIFDSIEAKKMGISYYPLPYSKIFPVNNSSDVKEADLYFIGKAKTRYSELIHVFEFCLANNITTNFYIIGVPKQDQKYKEQIHYVDFVPYDKTLEIMSKSNCGLELLVDGVTSYSQRVMEALVNNKKVLSNNLMIREASFYDEDRICLYTDIYSVDANFIKEKVKDTKDYADIFSPRKFLDFLEEKFTNDEF